jgi:hypothetical protein
MAVISVHLNPIRSSSLALAGALVLVLSAGLANAQTQASCQFKTFNRQIPINGHAHVLVPRGVNDYNTVVGSEEDETTFIVRGFTRWSDGSLTYFRHDNVSSTVFTDRDNNGIDTGVAGPSTSLASDDGTPFTLKGSTFTARGMTIGDITYTKFTIWGTNRWGTTVGAFKDSSGKMHGFKSFSNGNAIALDFPGSAETAAGAINDSGTIVGTYSNHLAPNEWRHGFMYSNGKWATLDYPATLQTTLSGISNANLIVGTTIKGTTQTGSFIYKNGAFKKIVLPNSNVPTYGRGVSASKGLIAGFSGNTGFIATCK